MLPSAAAPVADTMPSPVIRTSITESDDGSISGLKRDSGSQYLVIPDTATLKGAFSSPEFPPISPISVRPFSPTESWSFPRPPNRNSQLTTKDSASTLRPSSSAYLSARSVDFESKSDDHASAENPFADFVTVDSHFTSSTSVDASNADHFSEVEVIKRPFIPTMGDEMVVVPGDEVRVRKRFDDGWAYGEKLSDGKRGLFPIDCLRDKNEDLPAFLASKRISSYETKGLRVSQQPGTAV